MTHKEIHQRLPDYVLGLLTPVQANEVAQHLAGCATCCRSVQGEREIGALVRTTINTTINPEEARLRQLMPPIPQKREQGRFTANWTARLAPALVLLFVIIGSLLMTAPDSKRPMSIFFAATATATSTNTPTATVAQDTGSYGDSAAAITEKITTEKPASEIRTPAQIIAAPVPLHSPTPIATGISTAAN